VLDEDFIPFDGLREFLFFLDHLKIFRSQSLILLLKQLNLLMQHLILIVFLLICFFFLHFCQVIFYSSDIIIKLFERSIVVFMYLFNNILESLSFLWYSWRGLPSNDLTIFFFGVKLLKLVYGLFEIGTSHSGFKGWLLLIAKFWAFTIILMH